MPVILRIFLTKIVALVYDITPYAPIGVVVGLRPKGTHPPCGPWRRHVDLQHYEVPSVGVALLL